MRVLHVYKTSLPETMGGTEQVIRTLAMQSHRYAVHSEVATLCADDRLAGISAQGPYTLHRFQRDFEVASMPVSMRLLRHFARLARRFDLIHYHYPWPFMDLLHLAGAARTPSVLTYHSDIVRQRHLLRLYRPLQRRFLDRVDHIVATSPNYRATSPVLAGYQPKLSVIPIGLDQSSHHTPDTERAQRWRTRLGPRFFLFVGVLRYYKGLQYLLQAVRETQIPVAIVGDGPEGARLRQQARQLGLTDVHFLGVLDEADKHALLSLCEGLVFPSHLRSEAFGITLLEAAMHAKPMISCEIGTGTSFVNVAGQTGLVVAPADPVALRDAMRYLWNHPQVASALGREALSRYRQHFTGAAMVHSYAALYRQVHASAG
ncbi:glycosyltransferase [Xanthomonas cassavae CFBP 4642]|uniref:Glycosyltransferase n=1 Tax=Xanthomonas cassavae CFBP 4642 TaxID=1219375 RepID=A0ABS8HBY6_9XANT|nr:glycosyltransferase [Xanthomonas cassavae CFBP 4642]